MADYEALAPGGHAHLVSDIKSYADRAGGKGTTQLADGAVTRAKLASDVIARLEGMHDMGDTLKGNNFFGTLAEGTVLTADDVYGAPASGVEVYGVSTQVQTTGKNLFNKDNTPRGYYNNDGEFVASNNFVWWSVPVAEGDVLRYRNCIYCTMTHWLNGVMVGRTGQTSGTDLTIPAGVDEIRGYCGTATLNTGIVALNNADVTYEPYSGGFASPSPSWTQPIESVDDLTLMLAGKNLFGGTALRDAALAGLSQNTTGTDSIGGNYVTIRAWSYDLFSMPFKDNTQYTLILRFSKSDTNANLNLAFVYTDGTYTSIQKQGMAASTLYTIAVTSAANKTIEKIRALNNSGITYCYYEGCGLFEGVVTADQFEPYVGTTTAIPLSDHTARSLPDNTRDQLTLSYIKKSTTSGYGVFSKVLTQRIDECDMGDLEWEYSTTYHMMHAEVDGMRTAESGTYTLYCTGYKDYNNATVSSLDTNMPDKSIAQRANYAILYVKDTGYTDAGLFTTAVTGMKVQYALATPVTHDLGMVELPVLPAPDLTAWCDGGSAQPSMSIGYEQDINIVIQGLEAAIAELATA